MKKFIVVFLFFVLILSTSQSIFAATESISSEIDLSNNKGIMTGTGNITTNIWSTIITIVQILAVAAVVFAGVRYMFASADAKADIKKQTVILVVGAVLVFGASTIASLIQTAATSAL